MYGTFDDEIYILKYGDFIIFVSISSSQAHIGSLLYKWYIYEDMMPFGGEYVMI